MQRAPSFMIAAHAFQQQRRVAFRIPFPYRAGGGCTHPSSLEPCSPETFIRADLFGAHFVSLFAPDIAEAQSRAEHRSLGGEDFAVIDEELPGGARQEKIE